MATLETWETDVVPKPYFFKLAVRVEICVHLPSPILGRLHSRGCNVPFGQVAMVAENPPDAASFVAVVQGGIAFATAILGRRVADFAVVVGPGDDSAHLVGSDLMVDAVLFVAAVDFADGLLNLMALFASGLQLVYPAVVRREVPGRLERRTVVAPLFIVSPYYGLLIPTESRRHVERVAWVRGQLGQTHAFAVDFDFAGTLIGRNGPRAAFEHWSVHVHYVNDVEGSNIATTASRKAEATPMSRLDASMSRSALFCRPRLRIMAAILVAALRVSAWWRTRSCGSV